jgi:putative peptide zinc metalloprotease protein
MLPSEVEAAYEKVIAEIREIECSSKIKLSGFLLRLPLVPKVVVNKIASYLSVAYYQPVALFLLAFIVTATVIAPRNDVFLKFTGEDLIWGYFFFFISLLLHELGHASACVRYGAQPSDIGFAIYMIFPAFYSDVTDAWKLKRLQRLIIDLGGIFFQLVVGAVYVVCYTLTQWTALKIAILMIASSCLLYLNPIFKFDGYWALSDALRVTNLSREPGRILRHIFYQQNQDSAKPLPWSVLMMGILAIYTVVSFSITAYFLWLVFPILWQELLGYPSLIATVINKFQSPSHLLTLGEIQSFLISTLMVGIVLLMFWRLLKFIVSAITGLWQRLVKK